MANRLHASTVGIRLHQFAAGSLSVIAYLSGWLPPLWVALGLSVLAMVSDRLLILDWLLRDKKHAYEQEDPGPRGHVPVRPRRCVSSCWAAGRFC